MDILRVLVAPAAPPRPIAIDALLVSMATGATEARRFTTVLPPRMTVGGSCSFRISWSDFSKKFSSTCVGGGRALREPLRRPRVSVVREVVFRTEPGGSRLGWGPSREARGSRLGWGDRDVSGLVAGDPGSPELSDPELSPRTIRTLPPEGRCEALGGGISWEKFWEKSDQRGEEEEFWERRKEGFWDAFSVLEWRRGGRILGRVLEEMGFEPVSSRPGFTTSNVVGKVSIRLTKDAFRIASSRRVNNFV